MKAYNNHIHSGIKKYFTLEGASRIRILNRFNLLCITYSLPFIIFSLWFKLYQSATVFSIGLIFYLISHKCIQRLHLDTAKILILFSTGLSVFYLSLLYGFDSGFHLYYFTSPLIVFSIFDFTEKRKIFFGFLLHLICILTLIYLNSADLTIFSNILNI